MSSSSGGVPLDVLCAGYELSQWRAKQLAGDMFDRHLLSFALNYAGYSAISGATALRSIRDAAVSVYTSDKFRLRGEFGEMLLHGALIDFYGAEPAVSKIYYEDTANHVVKGFDSVHVVADDTGLTIWLGEAKFYSGLDSALRSALADLKTHLEADFLRKEFIFITRKVDRDWPRAEEFKALIESARSLDEIASSIVVPVFLTYDSECVSAHDVVSQEYVDALTEEAEPALETFVAGLLLPLTVEVRLILVPLKSKSALVELMHQKLRALQEI